MNELDLQALFESCEQFVCPVTGVKIPLKNKEDIASHKEKLIAYYNQKEEEKVFEQEVQRCRDALWGCSSLEELNNCLFQIFQTKFGCSVQFKLTASKINMSARLGRVNTDKCYLAFDLDAANNLSDEPRKFLLSLVAMESLKLDPYSPYGHPFFVFSVQGSELFFKIAQWQHEKITKIELRALQQERLSQDARYLSLKESYHQSCVALHKEKQRHSAVERAYQEYRLQVCEALSEEIYSSAGKF